VAIFEILAQVDREIDRLKQARALLVSGQSVSASKRTAKKRNLTPEGRRRIIEAVKKRWAAQKKNRRVEAVQAS
jgi:hypothetical protein